MDYSIEKKLRSFKQIAQEKLQTILCSIPSPKDLIIEPSLIKPLEHICVASWIKSKGVKKIFKFDHKHSIPKQENIQVFLISADLVNFKFVLDQINGNENNDVKLLPNTTGITNYHVIVFPNVYKSFYKLLEEEGLYEIVTLHRFNWDFIYLDDGIMSLEIPQVFNEMFLNKDHSIQSSIVHSLRVLNMVIGKPEITLCFGEISEKLFETTERFEELKNNAKTQKSYSSDFTAMIMIDRNKDFPSALLTPAVYSGLLLETFKFCTGELEIHKQSSKVTNENLQIFNISESKTLDKKSFTTVLQMNSSYDEIFSENRYKHFSEASNLVRIQAKTLGFEVKNLNNMKLNEMHEYVANKLPKISNTKNKILKHLNVCEQIINKLGRNYQKQLSLEDDILNNTNRKQILQKIDEMLCINGCKLSIIRLVCLAHLSIGLYYDELLVFIQNYCNMFGQKYLYVFQLLANAGLLPKEIEMTKSKVLLSTFPMPKFQQTEFQANANRLKLIKNYVDKLNTSGTTKTLNTDSLACPSYVFNGLYVPLIAQLSSILLTSENIDDIYMKLGAIDKMRLYFNDQSTKLRNIKDLQSSIKKGDIQDKFPIKKRTLIIFVVGGVTYAEISACDLVAKLTNSKIIITSNCICSGNDIISSAF